MFSQDDTDHISMRPIAVFHGPRKHKYDAPRQGNLEQGTEAGVVAFYPSHVIKQALGDLAGFERIWLVYSFHHNRNWKPVARPPGASRKYGVFATRSPYRPNGIGLSCVRLLAVDGDRGELKVGEYDLLEGTPILDVKPYIPRYDAFPGAQAGWVDERDADAGEWGVHFSEQACEQCGWLKENRGPDLKAFAQRQLAFEPTDASRKRITSRGEEFTLAYRTWRITFRLEVESALVRISEVSSGYSHRELASLEDPYEDKTLHRLFVKNYGDDPASRPGGN